MACGCKNKGRRSTGPIFKPGASVRSTSGGIAAGPTPTQVRASKAVPPPVMNAAGLSAERRKTQALRRDAIMRTFGK